MKVTETTCESASEQFSYLACRPVNGIGWGQSSQLRFTILSNWTFHMLSMRHMIRKCIPNMPAVFLSWCSVSSVVRWSLVTARWSHVVHLWSLSTVCQVMVGWVASLVAVPNSAVDCGSVGSSSARWSHVTSGPHRGVSSLSILLWQPFCHGGMGTFLVVIAKRLENPPLLINIQHYSLF